MNKMPVPKLRFKDEKEKEYPNKEEKKIGSLIQEYTEKVNADSKLPILTSSKKYGIEYQEDHFAGKQRHNIEGYNVLPQNYCTYRNRSDGVDFTFNINTICKKGIISKFYPVFTSHKCNLFFLKTLLNNDPNAIRKIAYTAKGTSQKVLSINDLKKISISIPSLPEQEKIADFLTTYDHMIDIQSQRVEAMKTRKKGLLQKIFSQEIRFKDDQGKDYPVWEYHKINEFAKCVAGATPSTKYVEYWNHGTIPWMSSGEVNRRIIRFTDKKISKIGYDNSSTKLLPANTVVMALAGQGKTRGMVALTKIELCTNQSLCAIVVDSTIKSEYLYQYLLTRYDNLRLISSGDGTRGGLNLKLVGNYTVPVPSLQEQQKIADFLTAIDAQIEVEEKRLETMKTIKKGLLQQMFI